VSNLIERWNAFLVGGFGDGGILQGQTETVRVSPMRCAAFGKRAARIRLEFLQAMIAGAPIHRAAARRANRRNIADLVRDRLNDDDTLAGGLGSRHLKQ
jgi:hypothetical protein